MPDDRDSFPVPGLDRGRPASSGHRELFEKIPGLDDLLPPSLPRDPDTVDEEGPEERAEETGPPEPGPAGRAARLLQQMRRTYDDDDDDVADDREADEETLPELARASGERRGSSAKHDEGAADRNESNPFEDAGATTTHHRRARDARLSGDATDGGDRDRDKAGVRSGSAGDSAEGRSTGTLPPPRRAADAAKSPRPASAREEGTRYAVMLDPAGQVNIDRLIEVMAGFLEADARTARRTIRRGKGLLAIGVSRSEALVLESALVAEGQPIITTAIDPRMIYEPPRAIEAVHVADDGGVSVEYPDREVVHPTDSFFLLSAGVMREEDADGSPSATRLRLVLTMFGWMQSGCWRREVAVSAEELLRGDRCPAVRDFCGTLASLRGGLRDAQRTPIFDAMSDRLLDPKHYFIDRESLENYELWQLWTRLAEAG
jgi:hypothetical protein